MKYSLILLFIVLFNYVSGSERNPDAVKKDIEQARQDSVRIRLLIELSDLFIYKLPDTSLFYVNKALYLAEKNHYRKYIAEIYKETGICYDIKGRLKDAGY